MSTQAWGDLGQPPTKRRNYEEASVRNTHNTGSHLLQPLPDSPFTVRPRSREGERGPSLYSSAVDVTSVPGVFPLHPLNSRFTHKVQGKRLSS